MFPSLPITTHVSQGVPPTEPAPTSDLGAILSPSQTRTFIDCSAKWWFKFGLGLPDPAGGAFVRGRVVHKMAELYFRMRLAGATPDLDDMQQPFEEAWDMEAAKAAFDVSENPDELKRQAAVLSRMYLTDVAPEIQPAAIEMPVMGTIGGVPVRGVIDLLDVQGRVIDLKTAKKSPSGVSADYAFQVATYRQLTSKASGSVRLDTLVANKTPKIVTMAYTVSEVDLRYTQTMYPLVRETMRNGLYLPNRGSNLCSRKYCNFADACEVEYGGKVKGEKGDNE